LKKRAYLSYNTVCSQCRSSEGFEPCIGVVVSKR